MPIALAVGDLPPEATRADAISGPRAAADGLEAFLRRSEGRALVIAELSTRDREEALDLVQEAMLRFVRRYAGCPPGEWPALFHRVLTRALIDWTRRQRVRAAFRALFGARDEEEARDWPLTVAEPGPEAAASAAELSERLLRALAALPLRQRQVFLLRVWEGLAVEATARALGIGEGSVKTHLSRALARIKEALDGCL